MHPDRLRTLLYVVLALAAGAALRLWFIHLFRHAEGDSLMYGDIARNWLLHGVYGRSMRTASGLPYTSPTLIRLPGYPAFLALCFAIFGLENYRAVLYVQMAVDMASCVLIAIFVRRVCSGRAATIALFLSALCPFTANYVAAPLTETLSIFCVALALFAFAELLAHPRAIWVALLAFAWSYGALLRPDGALLAVILFFATIAYGRHTLGLARSVRFALICGAVAVLPFVAWTARNRFTFHLFQPLAPRYANDPGERTDPGFEHWTKTWIADFASTYEIYWNASSDDFNIDALPSRAFDSRAQYQETSRLFAEYNLHDTITPQLDAHFQALARNRVQAHPFRSDVVLPLMRLADMWLRPRLELFNFELRWWQYPRHHTETRFAFAYGALNLAYLIAAMAGFFYWPRFGVAMLAYVLLRSLLLLTVAAPETRYTLECFPILIAFASAALEHSAVRAGAS